MQEDQPSGSIWLLLLPRWPSEVSLHAFKVAYEPPLSAALREAANQTLLQGKRTVIDIGVAYDTSVRLTYEKIQFCFGLFYKLSCIICTDLQIDLQYDNDVDARFFLVTRTSDILKNQNLGGGRSPMPLSVEALVRCDRHWSKYFFVESEWGEEILRSFLRVCGESRLRDVPEDTVSRLPGGLVITNDATSSTSQGQRPISAHKSVAVGGTFDHLHAGHKLLLTMTALLFSGSEAPSSEQHAGLTIGITGDELLKPKKYKEVLEDWHQRQSSVKAFLMDYLKLILPRDYLLETQVVSSDNSESRAVVDIFESGLRIRYVEIFDPYGPTITDQAIEALVISAETRAGGDAVNKKRQEKHWPPLEVFEVGVVDGEDSISQGQTSTNAEDFQKKLSSTAIRARIYQKQIG